MSPVPPRARRRAAVAAVAAPGREEAVSNVVGAILFFALVVLVLVTVRTQYVPVWEEEREATHMDRVRTAFGALRAETDRQLQNGSALSVTEQVPLTSGGSNRFVSPNVVPGTLEMLPGSRGLNVSADELTVYFSTTSRFAFGADEEWVAFPPSGVISDIGLVQHLRVRVLDPEGGDDGDYVELQVEDADGDFAGALRVYIERHPSGYSVVTRTTNATNGTLYDQGESLFQQHTPAMFWINALADEVQFGSVLEAAEPPFTLRLVENSLDGEYAINYVEDDGSGILVLTGSGARTISDYHNAVAGGALSFRSRNSHYPDQRYLLENGALVLEQDGAAVFLVEPSFVVTRGTTRVQVEMDVAALTGDGTAASNRGSVGVTLRAQDVQQVSGTAPHLRVELGSEHPALWERFWRDTLVDAGLSEAAGQFSVTSDADSATLVVYGLVPAPASAVHDLVVVLRTGEVATVVGP